MFGTFQQSQLRLETKATAAQISAALLGSAQLRRWLFPQIILDPLPPELAMGVTFTSWTGCIPIEHQVELVTADSLRLCLSRGVDGIHTWHWGEAWVQSSLEGVSYLPLPVANMASLLRLKAYLALPDWLRRSP